MAGIPSNWSENAQHAARAHRLAEFAAWEHLLGVTEMLSVATESIESTFERQAARSMVALEYGQAVGLSEYQVAHRAAVTARLRDHTPRTWIAWSEGRLDAARACEISGVVAKLKRANSVERLDARVVAYAEAHTVSELRAWLRRFVLRVEGDLAAERAQDERANRDVRFWHGDDGMGGMEVYHASFVLAAIEKRLTKEAEALGADDPRTMSQRRADLFAAWMTTGEGSEPQVNADIAVTIEADVLAGARDACGLSSDGLWGVPAAWITELIESGDPFWHRIVLDPVTKDVLSHEYLGRYAPEALAKALRFRDGVCRAPGCLKPADRCDLDHRRPWPEGQTSGENMWALCRRHHQAKGHHVLTVRVA